MTKKIPFSKPCINSREIKAVSEVIRSGWLTYGPKTIEFENKFAEYVGAKNAIAVNSCTAALFLALKSVGVKKGDKVVVPSFTFTATAAAVEHCGAIPVFGDIDRNNFCLDFKGSFKGIKAITPVHYGGNIAKTDYPVTVIEDGAHLLEKNHDSENLVCYSFYATKNITCGQGGMITTNDNKKANWFRKARLHGMDLQAWKRYSNEGKWKYKVEFCGWNYNLTDIASAMGLEQLKKAENINNERKRCVDRYNNLLDYGNRGLHVYPILVKDQNYFIKLMLRFGIQTSVLFQPLHLMPAYKKYQNRKLPITEFVGKRIVNLPLFPELSDENVDYICEKVVESKQLIRF